MMLRAVRNSSAQTRLAQGTSPSSIRLIQRKATRLDEVGGRGAHRLAIDPACPDTATLQLLDRVVQRQHDGTARHEGLDEPSD